MNKVLLGICLTTLSISCMPASTILPSKHPGYTQAAEAAAKQFVCPSHLFRRNSFDKSDNIWSFFCVDDTDTQQGNTLQIWPNGQTRLKSTFLNGEFQGVFQKFYENGRKHEEGSFVKDAQDGTWQVWAKNGVLLSVATYHDGLPYGKFTEWYENGRKKVEGEYSNSQGYRIGTWVFYSPDGVYTSTGHYTNDGRETGLWVQKNKQGQIVYQIDHDAKDAKQP